MLNATLLRKTVFTILLGTLFALSGLSAQPAYFDMVCPGDGRNSQPIQATIEINGENAVPDQDYIALFDSDGFVVGMGTVIPSTGFCPQQATITLINFGVFGVPPNDDAGCPFGFGANDDEVLTGLVYDGSENTYYNLPGNLTYAAGGLSLLPAGALCTPISAFEVILPATLTAFRGTAAGPKHVRLDWDVAREENVSHYDVQRSRNGQEWEVIGSVTAAGDSDVALNYDYDDLDPQGQRAYYRLHMIDLDGAEEYSGIVIVELDQSGERTLSVFPNPATTRLGIQLGGAWNEDQPIVATFYDVTGRRLAEYRQLGQGTTSVALPSGIESGLYVLRVAQADRVITRKVSVR